MSLAPRVVLVHRRTELDELVGRHGTRGQAAFFLSTRGRQLDEVERRHALDAATIRTVGSAAPLDWRRGVVERADLPRFLFAPDDIVVAIGQDGLVANLSRYLDGQPVIGINPDPERNPGVLVPHPAGAAEALLRVASSPRVDVHVEARVMVEAILDDGQRLRALNEIFIGHSSHQTARYTITDPDGPAERQASSGVIVATGTGATGWCRSAALERRSAVHLPGPTDRRLAWFVREAWPSRVTGTTATEGVLEDAQALTITVESDQLVAFGDGMEADALTLSMGQTIRVHVADQRLRLVR